jgi:hypothetical protein
MKIKETIDLTLKKLKKKKKLKKIVGWREWVQLPDLTSQKIKAKIDTGARTSAIHAEDIVIFRRGGKKWAYFSILPKQKNPHKTKTLLMEVVEKRKVRSSVGHETVRPVVKTLLKIGNEEFEIELTLVNRDIMGFRMLIGRTALRPRFLVDPNKSFLSDKEQSQE